MDDMVSRQAAIDAIENAFDRETILNRFVRKIAISAVRLLPSAQPEKRTNERTETHACDLISRQAAIDAMAKTLWYYPNACYRNLNEYEVAKGLAELGLKSVSPVQPEQHWIPCSERMPEKNGIYFVSYEDADTWLLEWFNGKWFVYPSNPAREETGTITAWMPLPEPYVER